MALMMSRSTFPLSRLLSRALFYNQFLLVIFYCSHTLTTSPCLPLSLSEAISHHCSQCLYARVKLLPGITLARWTQYKLTDACHVVIAIDCLGISVISACGYYTSGKVMQRSKPTWY